MIKQVLSKTSLLLLLSVAATAKSEDAQRVFLSFDASNGLADNSAQTLRCAQSGRIVITTIGHVNFYDGSSFTHIDPLKEDVYPLEKYHGHYHLYYDKHRHLWLKDKRQVTCVNLEIEHFEHDVSKVFRDLNIPQPVDDLFSDSDSCLWTQTGNILYGLEHHLKITLKNGLELHDLDVLDNELLLFYNDGSVSVYDVHSGKQKRELKGNLAEHETYQSSVILADGHSFLQICNGETKAELRRLDMKTHEWTTLLSTPYHLNNMAVHHGRIYIACEYGYWMYDKKTGASEHVAALQLTKGRSLNTDVNTLCFDHQGGMWIGTEKRGLLYSRPYAIPFKNYPWSDPKATDYVLKLEAVLGEIPSYHRPVNCIYKDSRGWTWTGTYTGLQLQRHADDSIQTFRRIDGLINEMVHSVVEDENHDIWAGTSFGLTHLYIKGNDVVRVETYYNRDDVPNESFVNGRAVMMPDSTIVMQTLDHMIVFRASSFRHFKPEESILHPKMVRLMVNGHQVSTNVPLDGKVIIHKTPLRTRDIYVNYNQATLNLAFSGMNYFRPVQTYYRVRVKGIPRFNDWQVLSYSNSGGLVDKNGLFHLSLMDLTPGEYQVELQASLDPGVWNEQPEVWVIHVDQPWWRTTGLYLTLGILVLLLLVANLVFYNRNMRMRLMRRNEEVELVKRIKIFAHRCYALKKEKLGMANYESIYSDVTMSEEFVDIMLKIVPYVLRMGSKPISISELAQVAAIDTVHFYELLDRDLDKSPRMLVDRLDFSELSTLVSHKAPTSVC